ncbi:DUF368 domain-containing protein [Marinomonas epiphytica]
MPNWLKIYLSGLVMGAADVVPGVSGGTMAFILGVYDRLIRALSGVNKQSIRLLLKGDFKGLWRHFDGAFLLPLGLGIVTSIVALAKLVSYLLVNHPTPLWSFFFGLILASAYFLMTQIKELKWSHLVLLVFGVIIGAALSRLVPVQLEISYLMVFLSGMIAICAMILPGISGSFLLLMMGMYGFIITSIKSFDLPILVVFSCGALVGLLSFSKCLNYLLTKARSATLATLTGVMLGALVKVWPWKEAQSWVQVGDKKLPLEEALVLPWQQVGFIMVDDFLIPLSFMFIGFISVMSLSYKSSRKETNRKS